MIVVADSANRVVIIAHDDGESGWTVSPKNARFIADLCESAVAGADGQATVIVDNIGDGTLTLVARPDQLRLFGVNLRSEADAAEATHQ